MVISSSKIKIELEEIQMKKLLLISIAFLSLCIINSSLAVERKSGKTKSGEETIEVTKPAKSGKTIGKSGTVAPPKTSGNKPKVTNGSASLVFFYYGDSPFITLFQETTELIRAMENYDKVVLLKHEKVDNTYIVSLPALNKADVVEKPTKANLKKYLKKLAKDGYMIDLWIFSHGAKDKYFIVSEGTDGSSDEFTYNDILTVQKESEFSQLPIRMVYQGICYGRNLIEAWRKIGAKVALGARDVNFYPYEFARFATQWNKGETFKTSSDKADENTPKGPAYLYIRDIDAPKQKNAGQWNGCPFGYNVLGTTDKAKKCGKEYFTEVWETPWNGDGKSTMDFTSLKIVAGDPNITKNTIPTW